MCDVPLFMGCSPGDYLLGHERRRVGRDEERILKRFRKGTLPMELLVDYLYGESCEDIIILADMEEEL